MPREPQGGYASSATFLDPRSFNGQLMSPVEAVSSTYTHHADGLPAELGHAQRSFDSAPTPQSAALIGMPGVDAAEWKKERTWDYESTPQSFVTSPWSAVGVSQAPSYTDDPARPVISFNKSLDFRTRCTWDLFPDTPIAFSRQPTEQQLRLAWNGPHGSGFQDFPWPMSDVPLMYSLHQAQKQPQECRMLPFESMLLVQSTHGQNKHKAKATLHSRISRLHQQ